jgi:hypothetical protein
MQIKPIRRPRQQPPRPADVDDPWAGEDASWECDDDLRGERSGEFMRFFRGTALAVVLGIVVWAAVVLLLFQVL